MRLTPKETERLTIFTVAELARRRRTRGKRLSVPEVTALICDEVLEASWDGASLDEVVAIGKQVVSEDDVMEGVRDLIRRIELDCLFPSGTCLVVVEDPVSPGAYSGGHFGTVKSIPGEVSPSPGSVVLNAGRRTIEVEVANQGDRPVFISSHFPFSQVNAALRFAREQTVSMRLDIPAGSSLIFPPGERITVRLVELGGTRTEPQLQIRGGGPSRPQGAKDGG